jgi:hypothetical protein
MLDTVSITAVAAMSDTALLDVTELHKHFHNRNQPVVRAM